MVILKETALNEYICVIFKIACGCVVYVYVANADGI
jgi:hypothetical protein